MVSNLMALYLWTGEERYRQRAEAVLKAFAGAMRHNVLAHAGLHAAELDIMAPALVAFVVPEGSDAHGLRRALKEVSLPGAVVQEIRAGESLPASSPAHGKTAIDGKPTAYVHRPAMLVAGDGAREARRDDQGRAASRVRLRLSVELVRYSSTRRSRRCSWSA
jgi:uncharacterized protein YyaL (SSP411 family)